MIDALLLILLPICFGISSRLSGRLQHAHNYLYLFSILLTIAIMQIYDLNYYYNLGGFSKELGIQFQITPIKTKLLTLLYTIYFFLALKNTPIHFLHASANFLILSNDIFHTYIALELLNISLILLLVSARVNTKSILNYSINNFAAAACILLGIGFIYMEHGYLNNAGNNSNLANYLITAGFMLKLPVNPIVRESYRNFQHLEYIATISSITVLYSLSTLFTIDPIISAAVIVYNLFVLLRSQDCLDKILIYSGINSIFTISILSFPMFLFYDSIAKFILIRSYRKNNLLLGIISFALYIDAPISLYYFYEKIELILNLDSSMQILFILFKIVTLYASYDIFWKLLKTKMPFDYKFTTMLCMILFYY